MAKVLGISTSNAALLKLIGEMQIGRIRALRVRTPPLSQLKIVSYLREERIFSSSSSSELFAGST